MLQAGEMAFSREEHTKSNTKWPALKINTEVALYRLSKLYLIMYIIYIYAYNIFYEKIGYKYE